MRITTIAAAILLSVTVACSSAETEEPTLENSEEAQAAEVSDEAKKSAEEEKLAAEKKAEEEKLAAEKSAEEEKLAAEKSAEEEKLASAQTMNTSSNSGELIEEDTCKSNDDIRRISIVKPQDKLCSVVYEKHGQAQEVAWAHNDASHCPNVKNQIKSNLSNAGFICTNLPSDQTAEADEASSAPETQEQEQETASEDSATTKETDVAKSTNETDETTTE